MKQYPLCAQLFERQGKERLQAPVRIPKSVDPRDSCEHRNALRSTRDKEAASARRTVERLVDRRDGFDPIVAQGVQDSIGTLLLDSGRYPFPALT